MSRRTGWLGGLLLAALAGCSPEPPPSILLVTFDTTRADRIGAYGHGGAITPTLDRLAAEGVLFEQAIAPAPITLPSHASILTGVYPSAHGVRDNGIFLLDAGAKLVSEVLQERGWHTGAFLGAFVLAPRFGLDQGFDTYRFPKDKANLRGGGQVERPANEVVEDALRWISFLPAGERFFAWLHFFDPHQPFTPPDNWAGRLPHPYDGEIAFADAALGMLLRAIEERGLAERLLVAVTADHGDALGEHGEQSHGVFVYQSTLHVPLILWGAPLEGLRGVRVAHPVSLVDLPATLLALAGIAPESLPDAVQRPLVEPGGVVPGPDPDRSIHFETLLPYYSFRWHGYRGLLWDDHKLVVGVDPELYDLAEDPRERVDLADRDPERVARMLERMKRSGPGVAALGWGGGREVDLEEADLLRSLGYVAGLEGGDPFASELPDARERIGDIELVSRANDAIARAARALPEDPELRARRSPKRRTRGLRYLEEARVALEELRRRNPDDPHVFVGLGTVYSRLGKHELAIPLLEQAVRMRPSDTALTRRLELSRQAVKP